MSLEDEWPGVAERFAKELAADLPQLRLDFTPVSLDRLESEVLRRFSDPAQLAGTETRPFVDRAAAYFGEVMCRGWGGWGWSPAWEWEASSPWEGDDRPEINPRRDLLYASSRSIDGFVPWDVIAEAVAIRSGSELFSRYNEWDDAAMEIAGEEEMA
ncbi:hypothetical protein [Nocardia wallacei]|uniref:Uncharacterized protein n=1 Tax=Nocardia wallacei TaxID=480035 RepID=A0A7G1KVC5_9NOCA|nr:hypothetical protein [Nocardia wallacei]BCK59137.1 hypothetical protein NWFMUON74_69090 [Nocardia wallacei]